MRLGSAAIALSLLLVGMAPAPGAIEGRVTIRERPALRIANRYTGAGGGATRELPPIPPIAYLVATGGGGGGGASPELAQRDTAFSPLVLVVSPGTTVRFPNYDSFFHNVFSFSKPKRFDLGRYPRGESKSVTFDEPGVVKIYCEVHKWMRAAILVTESAHHTEVGADGRFSLRGVQPGNYRLVIWHFDRGEKSVPVTVPSAGTARVDVTL